MINLFLFLVAILLCVVFAPIAIMYKIIKSVVLRKFGWGWFKSLAYSVDQFGNVLAQDLFNDIFTDRYSCHFFGNPDETISSVIGKNKVKGTLTFAGEFLRWMLSLFEKDHSIKAIEDDE